MGHGQVHYNRTQVAVIPNCRFIAVACGHRRAHNQLQV
jgi:hypothetical protein